MIPAHLLWNLPEDGLYSPRELSYSLLCELFPSICTNTFRDRELKIEDVQFVLATPHHTQC